MKIFEKVKRDKELDYVTPLMFGAVGNGVVDDSEAFIKAIKYGVENKLKVVIPSNVIMGIDRLISIPSYLHLVINGKIQALSSKRCALEFFDRVTETPEYTGVHDVIIEGNGTFDLRGNLFANYGGLLRIYHCKDILIKDITLKNTETYHLVEVGGSKNVTFDNVKFKGLFKNATPPDYTVVPEYVQYETVSEEGADGAIPYDQTPCDTLIFKNCLFDISEEGGYFYKAIGNHGRRANPFSPHKNIIIENCTFQNSNFYDYKGGVIYVAADTENVRVNNNTFINLGGNGVCFDKVSGVKNVEIKNNLFRNIMGSGINIHNSVSTGDEPIKNITIRDNVFDECAMDDYINKKENQLYSSLHIWYVENCLVENNVFYCHEENFNHRPLHTDSTHKEASKNLLIRNNTFYQDGYENFINFLRLNTTEEILWTGNGCYYGEMTLNKDINFFDEIKVYYKLGNDHKKAVSFSPQDILASNFTLKDFNLPDNPDGATSVYFTEMVIKVTPTLFTVVNSTIFDVLQQNGSKKTDNEAPSGGQLFTNIYKIVGVNNNNKILLKTKE